MTGRDRLARWAIVVLMVVVAWQGYRLHQLERDTVRVVEVLP